MDGSALLTAETRTTCPYCGVGCGIVASTDAQGSVQVRGDREHPANHGRLCSKGSALGETFSLDGRLLYPEIGSQRVGWNDALSTVAQRFREVIDQHGPDAVAFYVSGQLLTEDYYVANKLIKGFIGTANIDTNSRLCMASSVAGHRRAFGSDTVPGIYEDLELADLVVLVGSNLAWCHPVLFQRLGAARRVRTNLKVVVIDPRRTTTAEDADLHLPLRPGSDAVLFNGLLTHLARSGRRAARFVDMHTVGEEAAVSAARQGGSITEVAAACGLSESAVRVFFDLFAARERTVTVYSQGINQSATGTDKVNAIINCHLYTGRIGRPGMGPFSVTGQPNAMGGREVGALANQLAAHMDFGPTDRDRVQRFWRGPRLAARPGLKAVDLFTAVGDGRIKALWVMATNPAVSLPESGAVHRALAACPFVVVSDGVRETETAKYAHVKLPALLWGEKDGTVTNSERRISRQRAFRPPPGESRPDWWIVSGVARRMGFGDAFAYREPADIFREHAALSAFENDGSRDFDLGAFTQLDEPAYQALDPVQWPARADGTVATRLFGDGRFFAADRRATLVPVVPAGPKYGRDSDYPFALNTGRVRDQWHTMTRTAIPRLMEHTPEPAITLHPADAAALGLFDGQIARVESRWGTALFRVAISEAQSRGDAFAPMHWNGALAHASAVNATVNPATDPFSGQPELKHTPVKISRVPTAWYGVLIARTAGALPQLTYSAAVPARGFWRIEMADVRPLADVLPDLLAQVAGGRAPSIEYADAGLACVRAAWFDADRLEAALFIGRSDSLPARSWLADLVAAEQLQEIDRSGLLQGRPATHLPDVGPTICVCHGVGRNAIVHAIDQGAGTAEQIGAETRAGTNCGSCLPELRRLLQTRRSPALT